MQRILIQSVYQFVSRGILKADRPKFILHLIHAIYPKQVPDDVNIAIMIRFYGF